MPGLGPSEFGGLPKRNRVQPLPHEPTRSEALMLLYTTGEEDGSLDFDAGETFAGLLPRDVQLRLRTEAGDMEKGQVWREMTGE